MRKDPYKNFFWSEEMSSSCSGKKVRGSQQLIKKWLELGGHSERKENEVARKIWTFKESLSRQFLTGGRR